MRAANVLFGLMLALVVAQAWAYLPRLSEPLPMHFGLDGRPDAWTDPAGVLRLTAFVALLAAGIGYGAPWLAARLPGGLRLPRRDEWMSTPAGRERVHQRMGTSLRIVAAATLALFLSIQQWAYASALRGTPSVPPGAVLALVGAYLAAVGVTVVRMQLAFRRGPRATSGEASDARLYSAGHGPDAR